MKVEGEGMHRCPAQTLAATFRATAPATSCRQSSYFSTILTSLCPENLATARMLPLVTSNAAVIEACRIA